MCDILLYQKIEWYCQNRNSRNKRMERLSLPQFWTDQKQTIINHCRLYWTQKWNGKSPEFDHSIQTNNVFGQNSIPTTMSLCMNWMYSEPFQVQPWVPFVHSTEICRYLRCTNFDQHNCQVRNRNQVFSMKVPPSVEYWRLAPSQIFRASQNMLTIRTGLIRLLKSKTRTLHLWIFLHNCKRSYQSSGDPTLCTTRAKKSRIWKEYQEPTGIASHLKSITAEPSQNLPCIWVRRNRNPHC